MMTVFRTNVFLSWVRKSCDQPLTNPAGKDRLVVISVFFNLNPSVLFPEHFYFFSGKAIFGHKRLNIKQACHIRRNYFFSTSCYLLEWLQAHQEQITLVSLLFFLFSSSLPVSLPFYASKENLPPSQRIF